MRKFFELYTARAKKKMRRLFLAFRRLIVVMIAKLSDVVKRRLEKFYTLYRLYSRRKFRLLRQYLKQHAFHLISHKQFHAMLAVVFVVVIFVYIFQPKIKNFAWGATFTFIQNSWVGGANSGATMAHPTDETGWNKYYDAANIVASSSLELSTSTGSFSFGGRTEVTNNTSESGVSAVSDIPSIVVNTSTGVMYAVYSSNELYPNTTKYNIALRTSTDGGATWSARVDLTTNGTLYSRNPRISLDSSNNLYVVYYSNEFSGAQRTNIALRKSTDGGATWGARVDVTTNTARDAIYPSDIIHDSSNNLYVAYVSTELNSSYNNIAVRKSTDGGATWSARMDLTALSSYFLPPPPSIAVDSSNNLYVAYYSKELNSTYYNIAMRTSTNGGATWGARVDVTSSTRHSTNPMIARDSSNNLYVVYSSTELNSTYYNIAMRTSTNGGATWGSRKDVTANTTVNSQNPMIARDSSNNLYITYSSAEYNSTYTNIAVRTSTNGGATWSARRDLTTSTAGSQVYPNIALDGSNNIFVAYVSSEYSLGDSNISLRASSLNNYGTRKDLTTILNQDSVNSSIAINTSTGVMYAVYYSYEYSSGAYNIAVRTSTDGGATWGARIDLTTGTTNDSLNPNIALDSSGNVYVTYYSKEYNSTYTNIALRKSTDGGATWGARVDVTSNAAANVNSYNPSMVLDSSNNLYIAYYSTEFSTSRSNIALRKSTDGGATWGARVDVTATTTIASQNPSIVLDSSNNLYIAYLSKEFNASYDNIALRKSTDGGATWGARVDVTTNTIKTSYSPSLIIGSTGNLYIAYYSNEFSSYYNIALRKSTDGGATWSARVDVTSNAGAQYTYNPSIAVSPAGNLYIAYYSLEFNSSYYNVAYRTSNDDGATWSARTDITTSTVARSMNPALVLNPASGILYLTYSSREYTSFTDNITIKSGSIGNYNSSGNLISSPYDTTDGRNVMSELAWDEGASLPANTTVTVSLRTASSSAGLSSASWSDFTNATSNCTKSDITVTCPLSALPAGLTDSSDDQWWQYKVAFTGGFNTPSVSRVSVKYIVNSTPQIQGVTASQDASSTNVIISYAAKDTDTETDTGSINMVSTTYQYCNADGSNCQDISSQMSAGANTLSINSSTFTTTTVTWTPAGAFLNINNANAMIKVTVNDNQPANNTAFATSSAFVLDTATPSGGSILVDASSTPASLTLFATDSSTLEMKISLNSDVSGASWQPYATTSTIALATDPETVYVQFRDVHNNTSSIYSVTTPETPTRVMIQDISNVKDGASDYRLFFAWKVVANPIPGFGSYKVYRSTDQVEWTLIKTETTRTSNFYTDNSVTADTVYYYRIITVDSSGNYSYYSTTLSGNANGTQDRDEGGGASAVAATPTITNVATSSVSQNSVLITWDTDVLSDSVVMYGTDSSSLSNTVSVSTMLDNSASVGNHQVSLVGLAPNTNYYFKVISTNVDGIAVSSTNDGLGFSFSTLNGTTISGVSNPQVHNNSAIITWDTSDSASEYVVYSTSSNFAPSLTAGSPGPYTSHSVTLTGLSPATNYFYYVYSVYNDVTSSDKNIINGNIEYYRFKTTNDTSAPTITNITESSLVNTSTITWVTNKPADSQIIYGTSTDFGSTTTLDSVLTVQHSVVITGLAANTLYHYQIRSTDANGLLGQSGGDRTFTTLAGTDVTAPVISNVATSSVSLTGATITWNTDEAANHLVDYGTSGSYGYLAGDLSNFSTTSHSVDLVNLTGNTLYYFRVRSQDATGNTATSAQFSFTTVPDISDPIITNVTTAVVNQDSAVITWNTNEPATSEVDYDTNTTSFSFTNTTSTLGTSHTITLTGLTKDTTYYYQIKSADASNNIASSNNSGNYYTFTTLKTPGDTITVIGGGGGGAAVDRTAPVLSSVTASDIWPDMAMVKWITDEESNSLVRYGVATSYGHLAGNDQEKVTNHSVVLNNLDSASNYHFKAVSYDASGNMGESVDTIFTTLNENGTVATSTQSTTEPLDSYFLSRLKTASKDTISTIFEALNSNPSLKDVSEPVFVKALTEMTDKVVLAPSIVGIKPQVEVKGTTAIITWSTDKKSTTAVNYAREWEYKASDPTPYTNTSVNADEFSVTHHIALDGLDPGTTYHYQVSSKGMIGPEAKSKDYTFQTTSELPVISDVRVQKAKESAITISWRTNVPTAAILEYTNQRTKTTLSQGDTALFTNHELTLKNLEGATTYSLVIKATDEFNNQVASLPIKFSTVIDQIPPVISKLSSDSTLYPGKNSKIQTIISWETDEPATSQLFYQEGVQANGTPIALPIDTALTTRHIIVATKFSPGAVYKYWVESKDFSGNTSKSEIFSLLAPQAKETIVDIIIKNFEGVFGWTKNVGK